MTNQVHHGCASKRLHHSRLGTVRADADPRIDRGKARAWLSRRARPARARSRHALSADAARLPADARPLPRRDLGHRRGPAAHRRHRRRGRGRSRVRAGGDRCAGSGRARPAAGTRRARTADVAGAARTQMGGEHHARQERRGAARRRQSGLGARARRRPRAPHGRHDDARRGVGAARRAGARGARPLLAAYPRLPEDCAGELARHPGRARRHRAGGTARRADQGRSGAAHRPCRWPGHRRRLHRLDARNRRGFPTAPWCCPASTSSSMRSPGT
jgi:hypothetical protein